jgi:hypothetical protein
MLQTETESKWILCKQFEETVEYIISTCPVLAKEQYRKGHDRVCAQLHFKMCKEVGIQLEDEHQYDYVPKSVETNHEGKVTI